MFSVSELQLGVIWLLFHFTLIHGEAAKERINIEIVSPGLLGSSVPATITLAGPAFDVGIAQLQDRYPRFNFSHTYLNRSDILDCQTLQDEVQGILGQWYYRSRRVDSIPVIITPGCIETQQINTLAAQWNILFMSASNSDPIIHNKTQSPTWVTTNLYPSPYYSVIFGELLRLHRWKQVGVLLDESAAGFYILMANRTREGLVDANIPANYTVYNSQEQSFDYSSYLLAFKTRNRILLYFGLPTELRKVLIAASLQNMTNGEYVYITGQSFPWKGFGYYDWFMNRTDDHIVHEAYGSLILLKMIDMDLSPLPDPNSTMALWTERYANNALYLNTHLDAEPPLPILSPTAAALDIFGQVANEAPEADLANGTLLAQMMLNRTFTTSNVGPVTLNQFGEPTPLLVTASFFDRVSGKFVIYLRSRAAQEFQWETVQSVRWFNRSGLPPSEPRCGYAGDNPVCWPTDNSELLRTCLPIVAVLVAIGLLVALLDARRKKIKDPFWWHLDETVINWDRRNLIFSEYWYRFTRQTSCE